MARNTTRQGAAFELATMHDLEERGYTCLRSSGSRGAIDVVAVRTGGSEPGPVCAGLLFIQCKITNPVIPPHERMAVQGLALCAQAVPLVAFKERQGDGRTGISYRELTGPGPKEWRSWVPPIPEQTDTEENRHE